MLLSKTVGNKKIHECGQRVPSRVVFDRHLLLSKFQTKMTVGPFTLESWVKM
jgi:hypothetical protein